MSIQIEDFDTVFSVKYGNKEWSSVLMDDVEVKYMEYWRDRINTPEYAIAFVRDYLAVGSWYCRSKMKDLWWQLYVNAKKNAGMV